MGPHHHRIDRPPVSVRDHAERWSDNVDTPQDGLAIAADLHTLLARADESGPYVLVGHSAGGPYAMTFAAHYPDEVVGMVLLDSMSPYELTELPASPLSSR